MILLIKVYKKLIFIYKKLFLPSQVFMVGNVKINKNCKLRSCKLIGISEIDIGFCTTIMENVEINARINKIEIGNYCSIARNTLIIEYSHYLNRLTTYLINKNIFNEEMRNDIFSKGDIIIKNDVWIGANVVILSGVTIGNGVIVGANSVVKNSIPDFAIVSGNPAKIIRYRFDENIISQLLQIKWWNLKPSQLTLIKPYLNKDINTDILISIKNIIQSNKH